MKTLELRNGDLVLGPGGFGVLRGADKVRQDLAAALRENLGTDRFHPRYGTVLQDQIGGFQQAETEMLIQGEVNRIIQNYIMVQTEQITRDMDARRRPRHTPAEIISGIDSIRTQVTFDRINVRVTVRTFDGNSVTVLRTVEA